MKKIVSILSILFIVILTGCNNKASDKTNQEKQIEQYYTYAQGFVEKGETDKAIELLEDGIKKTDSEKLKTLLEELKKDSDKENTESIVSESSISETASQPSNNSPEASSSSKITSNPTTTSIPGEIKKIFSSKPSEYFKNQESHMDKYLQISYWYLGSCEVHCGEDDKVTSIEGNTNLLLSDINISSPDDVKKYFPNAKYPNVDYEDEIGNGAIIYDDNDAGLTLYFISDAKWLLIKKFDF